MPAQVAITLPRVGSLLAVMGRGYSLSSRRGFHPSQAFYTTGLPLFSEALDHQRSRPLVNLSASARSVLTNRERSPSVRFLEEKNHEP
jgi:hypothetical protein